MKRVLIILFLICCTSLVWAEEPGIYLNSVPLAIDKPPVNVNGRVLVPARALLESLGFSLKWDASTHKATASRGQYQIVMTIDNSMATVNGQTTTLDVPAMLVKGSTYVPLRFISESAGANVAYDSASGRVDVGTLTLSKPLFVPDPFLKEALQRAFGKNELTVADAYYVISLDLSRSGISTMTGLEVFKNIHELNLSGNRIVDIALISKLKSLQTLILADNDVRDISPLIELPALSSLNLQHNEVSSFIPIRSMKNLKKLWVQSNATDNFSPLYFSLEKLEFLDIDKSVVKMPEFDTLLLRISANFDTAIEKGINWVPYNSVGTSDLKNEFMVNLLKQNTSAKRGQLETPYEFVQMLAANKWFNYSNTVKAFEDVAGVKWQVYPGGHDTFRMNKGGQIGLAVAAHYALAMDYPEMGYLVTMEGLQPKTVLNYIKTQKYVVVRNEDDIEEKVLEESFYTFNPGACAIQSTDAAAPESGLQTDYNASKGLTVNMHKVSGLKAYAEALGKWDPSVTSVILLKSIPGEDISAFAIGHKDGSVVIPAQYSGKAEVLYSNEPQKTQIIYQGIDLKKDYFSTEASFEYYQYH